MPLGEHVVDGAGRAPAAARSPAAARYHRTAVSMVTRSSPPGPSAAVSRGEVRTFGPWYVHDVINASVQPAVSVHAYSPPLTSMRRFEFGPAGLERVTMETAVRW